MVSADSETGKKSGDYHFLHEKKHIRDSEMEELSRQLACFWVSREVKFEAYENLKEKQITKMSEPELKKLNEKFIYINGKKGPSFTQGYKIQFQKSIIAGADKRTYLTSATYCVAFRAATKKGDSNTFIIAIRGSQGTADWITNFNMEPQKAEATASRGASNPIVAGVPGLNLLDMNEIIKNMDKDHHIGFYKSVDYLFSDLKKLTFRTGDGRERTLSELVRDKKEKNGFLLCGFSKGAAMSQILAMKLSGALLYVSKGDEKRNGLCSYNFGGPNVFNDENQKPGASKSTKKAEALCREISLFNFNIEGDAINLSELVYKKKYGENYLIKSNLSEEDRLLKMVEIHEDWYRGLFEHIKSGELGAYEKLE